MKYLSTDPEWPAKAAELQKAANKEKNWWDWCPTCSKPIYLCEGDCKCALQAKQADRSTI